MQNNKFINKEDILAIHEIVLNTSGGMPGLRDEGLLESALSQPQQTFFGTLLHETIHEQASAYLFHLVKNHAFLDGNKRTATLTTLSFITLNGYKLTLSKEKTERLVLDVAESKVSKESLIQIFREYIVPKN